MTAVANDQRTGRSLVSEELFGSLAHFVAIHNAQTPERAERIADQAVAFLGTVATATVPMVPSDDVDMGLHAFILHTKAYGESATSTPGASCTTTPPPAAVAPSKPSPPRRMP